MIIYKATEVVNFAHGSLVLVGGYLVYALKDAIGWFAAAVVGVLGAALLALLIERLLLAEPQRRRRTAWPCSRSAST